MRGLGNHSWNYSFKTVPKILGSTSSHFNKPLSHLSGQGHLLLPVLLRTKFAGTTKTVQL